VPTSVSVEASGVCITTRNSEVSLTAVYKSSRARSDADITKPLRFQNKSLLLGDVNV